MYFPFFFSTTTNRLCHCAFNIPISVEYEGRRNRLHLSVALQQNTRDYLLRRKRALKPHVTGRLEKMQLAYHDKGKLSCEIHTMNHVHCSLWISLCASKWIPPRFLASVLGAAGEGPLGDKCEEGKGPAFLEGNDKHGIGVMSAALRIHYRRIQRRANEWVAIHDIDIQSFFAL